MMSTTSKKQIKVYHPDSSHPVGIQPDMLAHYEARGWSTEKPKSNKSTKPKAAKIKPETES